MAVKDAEPNDPQDFSFTAGGGLSPVELRPRRRLRRDALEHPHLRERRRRHRLLARRDGALRLGPELRHLQRRQPAGGHRPRAGRDRHLHLHEPQARRDRGGQGRAARRLAGLLLRRGWRAVSTSFQLDDDSDPALSNTRTFANLAPGSGYSVSEAIPVGWGQDSASCSDGSPPAEHRRRASARRSRAPSSTSADTPGRGARRPTGPRWSPPTLHAARPTRITARPCPTHRAGRRYRPRATSRRERPMQTAGPRT